MAVVCLLVLEVSLGHSMDFNSWAKVVHLISTFELLLVSRKLSVFLFSFAVMAQISSCHNKKEVTVIIFNTALHILEHLFALTKIPWRLNYFHVCFLSEVLNAPVLFLLISSTLYTFISLLFMHCKILTCQWICSEIH